MMRTPDGMVMEFQNTRGGGVSTHGGANPMWTGKPRPSLPEIDYVILG